MADVDWKLAEGVRDLPAVEEAIRAFLEDHTGDNATCMVRAILEAAQGAPEDPVALNEDPATSAMKKLVGDAPICGIEWGKGDPATPGGHAFVVMAFPAASKEQAEAIITAARTGRWLCDLKAEWQKHQGNGQQKLPV